MTEISIPDFIQKYLDELEYKGYTEFVKLAKSYNDEVQRFKNNQSVSAKEYDNALRIIKGSHEKEALQIAKKHGYKEILHEPELSKKQDDFLKKISDHKAKEALKNDAPAVVEDQQAIQDEAKAELIRQIQAERERNRQIEQERGRGR